MNMYEAEWVHEYQHPLWLSETLAQCKDLILLLAMQTQQYPRVNPARTVPGMPQLTRLGWHAHLQPISPGSVPQRSSSPGQWDGSPALSTTLRSQNKEQEPGRQGGDRSAIVAPGLCQACVAVVPCERAERCCVGSRGMHGAGTPHSWGKLY